MRQGWGCGLDPDNTGPQPTIWFSECFTERLKRPSLDQAPPASADRNRQWEHTGLTGSWGFLEPKNVTGVLVTLALHAVGRGSAPSAEVSSLGSWCSKNTLEFISPFWPGFPHLKIWSEKVSFGVWGCDFNQWSCRPGRFGEPSSLRTAVPVHPTEVRKAKE